MFSHLIIVLLPSVNIHSSKRLQFKLLIDFNFRQPALYDSIRLVENLEFHYSVTSASELFLPAQYLICIIFKKIIK